MYELPGVVKFTETESIIVITIGLRERGNRELLFNGYRVSVEDEKVLEMDSGDVCSTV